MLDDLIIMPVPTAWREYSRDSDPQHFAHPSVGRMLGLACVVCHLCRRCTYVQLRQWKTSNQAGLPTVT